jgi:hypothetical protein
MVPALCPCLKDYDRQILEACIDRGDPRHAALASVVASMARDANLALHPGVIAESLLADFMRGAEGSGSAVRQDPFAHFVMHLLNKRMIEWREASPQGALYVARGAEEELCNFLRERKDLAIYLNHQIMDDLISFADRKSYLKLFRTADGGTLSESGPFERRRQRTLTGDRVSRRRK